MSNLGSPLAPGLPPGPPPADLTLRDWKLYVLPLVTFLLLTSLEPAPPVPEAQTPAAESSQPGATAETPATAGAESAAAGDSLTVDKGSADESEPPAATNLETRPSRDTDESAAAGPPLESPPGTTPTQPWKVPYRFYPLVYTIKVAILLGMIAWFWPGYRTFAPRVSPLAVVVGVVGIVVWVGLVDLERGPLAGLSLSARFGIGSRTAYNPLVELADQPALAWAFLAVRFVGLALVVPVIEEFFLRGFLMRYFARPDWWQVPPGQWDLSGVAAVTAAAVAMHPGEILAAVAWFSLITVMYLRTRNLWDCVVAHAVTNLLLGSYVVATGNWYLM